MIFPEGLRIRLKLNSICLQDRRLQWFGHLERLEESAWYSKSRIFKVGDSFPRGKLRKKCNEVTGKKGKSAKI